MDNREERIIKLERENRQLLAENLALKTGHRTENDRRDIREAATEQVRQSQLRYRTIFENSLLGNKIIGPDLVILQVNSALLRMLGFDKTDDLVGQTIMEFAHPDFRADWQILQDKLWTKHLPSFNLETCLLRKDGKSVWVSVTSILFTDDGGPLGFTILEDIHERKIAHHSLLIREKRFRQITDIMPQQVWTARPDGRLNFVNQQIVDYFGITSEQLTGEGWPGFVHPDDRARCFTAWEHSVNTGQEYVVEFRLRGKDADYQWYLSRAVSIYDETELTLWLGTNTNIDAQKMNEQRKDEFISIASHELKTPLTSIKLYNQLLSRSAAPEKQQEFVVKSMAHIQRLERLIGDLFDVTKINAGKMTYQPEPFNFNEMVQQNIEAHAAISTSHQIVMELGEAVTVQADRHRIQQVVDNFISNAIKYSPEADRIIVRTQLVNDTVVFSVTDFGIGIKKEEMSQLFDRYYRADNTATRFDGLGLGLFISSEILKRHNGSFWIESEPGKGATFNFILPLDGKQLLVDLDTDGQTFYKSSFLDVSLNENGGWLEADWKGYQNEESMKKGFKIILDLFQKNNVNKLLNNNRQVLGNWSEAVDWIAGIWFPEMAKNGLKQFAWVDSGSAFSRLSSLKSAVNLTEKIALKFFDDKQEAISWLELS